MSQVERYKFETQPHEWPALGSWAAGCGIASLALSALIMVLGIAFCVALLDDRIPQVRDSWARFGLIFNLSIAALPALAAIVLGFASQSRAASGGREHRIASVGIRCGFTALILPAAGWFYYIIKWCA